MAQKRDIVNGILLLDKSIGLSSNTALQKTKYLLNAQKAGHTGSLDPLASGMLPLCFGEATKFCRFLLEERKCYQTVMRLGQRTSTGDSEGEVVATAPVPTLSIEAWEQVLAQFRGQQQQIPPMYSAIKHQGQPLYRLARQGKEIPRSKRDITIYRLILDQSPDQDPSAVSLTIECSKGTYIRTLVEDIGTHLGCGAHVSALRRLSVSPFQGTPMVTFDSLAAMEMNERQSHLISVGAVMPLLIPAVQLCSQSTHFLRQGQLVQVSSDAKLGWVSLLADDGEFIGVGELLSDGRVAPRRLLTWGGML
jgi:tRNA pseudouridine55 synthase